MKVRRYGDPALHYALVIVIHGGPGARGYMAPVARDLAQRGFRVIEPLQRLSRSNGVAPLKVTRHIADLDEVVRAAIAESAPGAPPPALLGSSWGAMLALAWAAEHPRRACPLVLVGCGTFDLASRAEFRRRLDERLGDVGRRRMDELRAIEDPDHRLTAIGDFLTPFYSHDLLTTDLEMERIDARGNSETWADMIRLQEAGVYPAALRSIQAPVLMVHGEADPHPGSMIRDSLRQYLPQLEYVELRRCGHYPWLERAARDRFFEVVEEWLAGGANAAPRGDSAAPRASRSDSDS